MKGMITRVSVTRTEIADDGRQHRVYTVVPGERKIIRAERLEELLDDLTLICQQLEAGNRIRPNGTVSADSGRALRRIT